MLKSFDQWRQRRQNQATYRQLSTLSPQMLNDIGLSADDLAALRQGRDIYRSDR